jgi:hypothetical protein
MRDAANTEGPAVADAELERSAKNDAQPRIQPDPPVLAFYLAIAGGGGPVNLVLLALTPQRRDVVNPCRCE